MSSIIAYEVQKQLQSALSLTWSNPLAPQYQDRKILQVVWVPLTLVEDAAWEWVCTNQRSYLKGIAQNNRKWPLGLYLFFKIEAKCDEGRDGSLSGISSVNSKEVKIESQFWLWINEKVSFYVTNRSSFCYNHRMSMRMLTRRTYIKQQKTKKQCWDRMAGEFCL